eukprot:TRINITY_DN112167_c0_g1_i1.p1 TRINITY_DN112167_c0_g1~~TRINITY_DN112167_c0_g1_i1.p1  ORF type:complete len:435 (+),score=93.20 TRINITY_DN112167_c0_g1_i1:79-1383(+)
MARTTIKSIISTGVAVADKPLASMGVEHISSWTTAPRVEGATTSLSCSASCSCLLELNALSLASVSTTASAGLCSLSFSEERDPLGDLEDCAGCRSRSITLEPVSESGDGATVQEAVAAAAGFKVGDSVDGLVFGYRPCGATILQDNGDGTFTLEWDDGYPLDTIKPAAELSARLDADMPISVRLDDSVDSDDDEFRGLTYRHVGTCSDSSDVEGKDDDDWVDDGYDMTWGFMDYASKRSGSSEEQQREDVAAAVDLRLRQAAALALAAARPEAETSNRLHYESVRSELLQEVKALQAAPLMAALSGLSSAPLRVLAPELSAERRIRDGPATRTADDLEKPSSSSPLLAIGEKPKRGVKRNSDSMSVDSLDLDALQDSSFPERERSAPAAGGSFGSYSFAANSFWPPAKAWRLSFADETIGDACEKAYSQYFSD